MPNLTPDGLRLVGDAAKRHGISLDAALALIELLGILVTMLFHNALVQRADATDLHFNTAFTATMALSVVNNLRMQATKATLGSLPASIRRW